MSDHNINEILSQMIKAAVAAGKIILRLYNEDVSVQIKSDSTPVTEADLESSEIIITKLKSHFPDAAFLCEETADEPNSRLSAESVFIIDPLDGTRAFIEHRDQFAVSISYVKGHAGIAGVIFAPAFDTLYYAAYGHGSWKVTHPTEDLVPFSGERIHVSDRTCGLRVLCGSGKNDPEADRLIEANLDRISSVRSVSSCIKGCLIAEGTADVHYKFADYTKEWDTSAEEIICREAGGVVTDAYGGELISNRQDVRNIRGIRILNDPASTLIIP